MEKVALTHTASQGASRKAVIVGLIILAIGSAWTGTGPRSGAAAATSGRLTVFAAASLADAFTLLGSVLEQRNPGLHVTMNLAGSQQLAQQIDQGARADVFASADQRWMDYIRDHGLIEGAPQEFVRNRLVVIVPSIPRGIRSIARRCFWGNSHLRPIRTAGRAPPRANVWIRLTCKCKS